MAFCLLFLTGLNFFLYPSLNPDNIELAATAEEESFPAPVEEKSTESTASSIIEEFLHDPHLLELSWFNKISMHKIHTAEKLQIVHFELLSPPPELG